jgi:phosphodiesterase/alkaline phosphatase D-like protein
MRRLRTVVIVASLAGALTALAVSSAGTPSSASAASAASAPSATTGSASKIAQSSATVSGTVNPNGTDTSYHFQYGTTTSYGSSTPSTSAGAGTSDTAVTADLTGLASSTQYHYRLVAVNSAGTTVDGADQTFTTTTPPAVTTGSASNVTRSSAGLSGTVNPKGQATTYYFRYGTTNAYGLQTSPTNAGSGTGPVGVHASIFGLNADTVYHYQLVAQNAGGTSYGTDQTVTTTDSQAVVLGHEGFVSPGWIVGVEIGCFHGTSRCTGHVTMSHDGTVIGQRDYSIAPDSGGFQNMKLTSTGQKMLGSNSTFHLLPVTVTATGSTGQKLSFVIHLARWVWH